MTSLILTEKPTASKRIAEALSKGRPIKKSYNGVPYYDIKYKDKRLLIGCAVGHLYSLTEKEKPNNYINYDLEWKPSYEVSKSSEFTKKYLDALKFLSKQCSDYIGATDEDTEGELILATCLKFICKVENAKRMHFGTLTKEDLLKAYENMSPEIDKKLAESGEARHYADFLWGIASSRALTSSVKLKGQFKILSSGRVQSPTLELLTKKEKEIQKFQPKSFWQLYAHIKVESNLLETLHEKDKFWVEQEVKRIFKKCKDKPAIVKKITKKEYKSLQPSPFNITSLQTESYRLFKFSPKQTLDIAQSLYLKAFISYPRTSSEKLPPQINYSRILKSLSRIKEFSQDSNKLLSKTKLYPMQGKKTDPAHEAIYPSHSPPKSIDKLNERERRLYTLIVKRFLSTFADPAIRESMEISFDINKEIFKIKGSKTLEPGWTNFYKPFLAFKEVNLPNLKQDEKYKVKKLETKEDETKPPNRYSQGSIIAEMEERNLGTRATRSNILQILYDRHYIEDRSIKVTPLGQAVASVLNKYVPDLVSEELTRHFEREMEKIQGGKQTKEKVVTEAIGTLKKILKEFKEKESEIGGELINAVRETQERNSFISTCPVCKKGTLNIKKGKYGFFISCDKYESDCKTTFSIPSGTFPKSINKTCTHCSYPLIQLIRKGRKPQEICINPKCKSKNVDKKLLEQKRNCPKCKAELVIRKSMYGQFYACPNYPKCRHTEPIEKFKKKDKDNEK